MTGYLTPYSVYGPELTIDIERHLATGPVVLVGPVGSGTEDVARSLAHRAHTGILLKPALTRNWDELVTSAVRQVLRSARSNKSASQVLSVPLQAAACYDKDASEALKIAHDGHAGHWTLSRALRGVHQHPPRVVVQNVERLPEQVIWELRDLVDSAAIELILTTRSAHINHLVGPAGALHGNARVIELPNPTMSNWGRVLAQLDWPLMQTDLEWVLERTRGRVATTLEVLGHRHAAQTPRMVWELAVRARLRHAADLLRLAGAVHDYAPSLLQAIADTKPPYAAIEGASSQRVARALNSLRDLDILEQPTSRKWQISDPLLQSAIALHGQRDNYLPTEAFISSPAEASNNQIQTALIGYGYWGQNLARNLVDHPQFVLDVMCDNTPERLITFARQYPHVRSTQDLDDIFDNPSIKAVVIATPPVTHYELAKRALQAGKHVLIEKPLATKLDDGRELADMARNSGLTLMPGHTFIYSPAVNAVRDLIRSDAIGDIHFVTCARMNLGKYQSEGVIRDLAPDDLSILLYWLDEPIVEIAASASSILRPGVPETAFMTLIFAGGPTANVQVSWLAPRKVRQMIVVGSKRMVQYDDTATDEPVRIYDRGIDMDSGPPSNFGEHQLLYRTGDVLTPRVEAKEPLRLELQDFADAVLTGKEPQSNMTLGLDVVGAIEMAELSMRNNGVPRQVANREVAAPRQVF